MKRIVLFIIVLALTGSALAKDKDINLADYPLIATVLSYESTNSRSAAPVMNNRTGVITGQTTVYSSDDREEFQIGDTVYITSLLRGCRHCEPLALGKTYQARLGQSHGLDTIQYLQIATDGKGFKLVTLEVTGQRKK